MNIYKLINGRLIRFKPPLSRHDFVHSFSLKYRDDAQYAYEGWVRKNVQKWSENGELIRPKFRLYWRNNDWKAKSLTY